MESQWDIWVSPQGKIAASSNYARLIIINICHDELWLSRVPGYLSRPMQKKIYSSMKQVFYGPPWLCSCCLYHPILNSLTGSLSKFLQKSSTNSENVLWKTHKSRSSDPAGWCCQFTDLTSLGEYMFNDICSWWPHPLLGDFSSRNEYCSCTQAGFGPMVEIFWMTDCR